MAKKNMTPAQLANLRKPWEKGESGNPNGRPKNRVKALHKKLGVIRELARCDGLNRVEIDEIERTVLSVTLSDLQLLAKEDSVPVLEKSYAMALIIDMKNGRTATADKLRERQYGGVKQQVEVTGKDGTALHPSIQVEVIDSRTQVDKDEDTDDENLHEDTESL